MCYEPSCVGLVAFFCRLGEADMWFFPHVSPWFLQKYILQTKTVILCGLKAFLGDLGSILWPLGLI